ncbi:protein POOR HOMOLOGOUS SYNAPSIS 1-like isoform X2 [Primulina eburnea]|uniref:protein POOR HOMOLOGOUS SYNAPSIS 1-like isoform X2 n=1 Tax=Primulina eburnea TaxID=1245227 RepID=UPI003C6C4311
MRHWTKYFATLLWTIYINRIGSSFSPQFENSEMAETPVATTSSLIDQWNIHYARFVNYRSTLVNHTHPSLTPISAAWKNRHQGGTWITTLSAASLKLIFKRTAEGLDDVVLVISLRSCVLEEHHISKVYFSWPQVSCVSGFPARGSRAVFVSYKDGIGQIQKFALHFFTVFETEKFMDVLKEIFANGSPRLLEYPGINSEISSQAEVLPFDGPRCRSDGDWQLTASAETSSPLMPPVLESNAVQEQFAPKTIELREAAETIASFPPSFLQLLNNCNPAVDEAKPIRHEKDLKTQFMRYLEGNSLQGMILEKQSSSFEMFGHRRNVQKISEIKFLIDQNLMELCLTTEKTWLPLTNGLV